MKIIVAVSKNWGIGNNNSLLFSLKEDMRFFRQTTTGATVVMGGNTFMSLPGSRPLKNRKNIVLSGRDLGCNGSTCGGVGSVGGELVQVSDLNALATALKQEKGEVFIIGGASVYRRMLPFCTHALVTKVDALVPADAFFDDLDGSDGWTRISESETIEDCGFRIKFTTYKNLDVKEFTGE